MAEVGGALNNRDLFLTILESGESTVQELEGSVPGEGSLPGLQSAAFLPRSHIMESRKRKQALFCLSL